MPKQFQSIYHNVSWIEWAILGTRSLYNQQSSESTSKTEVTQAYPKSILSPIGTIGL